MTERCVFSLAIRTQRANRHPYRIDHLLFVQGLLVVHQNETLACRSTARQLRQPQGPLGSGRLPGLLAVHRQLFTTQTRVTSPYLHEPRRRVPGHVGALDTTLCREIRILDEGPDSATPLDWQWMFTL